MCVNRFLICRHCGNVVGLLEDSGVPIRCCGEPMEHMVPNQKSDALQTHQPVVSRQNNRLHVCVGKSEHPMNTEHGIRWIYLSTTRGGHRKCPYPDQPPICEFELIDENPLAVFAFCNLHGLYQTDLTSTIKSSL